MNSQDFSIRSIELSNNQAEALYQRIVDAIQKYGIENFDKKTEVQVPELTKEDTITIYVELDIYTEAKEDRSHPFDYPEPEEITERSVGNLKIKLINKEGDEIDWNILGERKRLNGGRFITGTPLDIYEKINEHFRI